MMKILNTSRRPRAMAARIAVLVAIGLLPAFMFQSKDLRPRRAGIFPVVKYQMDPALAGAGPIDWTATIDNGALMWPRAGGAKLAFSNAGATQRHQASVPTDLSCSDATKSFFSNTTDLVFSASADDPDCTASVCVIQFTCGDEIQHAGIQVNPSQFPFGVAPELSGDALTALLAHAFGHAAGLDHCAPGDTAATCAARMGANQADPPVASLMHRFPGALTLQADDQAGIQKLYGVYTSPFAASGPYALAPPEIEAVAEAERTQNEMASFLPTPEKMRESAAEVMTYKPLSEGDVQSEVAAWEEGRAYVRPRLSVAEAAAQNAAGMNRFFHHTLDAIAGMTAEELQMLRVNSVLALDAHSRWKDAIAGDARIDPDVVQQTVQWWLFVREEVIREEIKRQQTP